MPGIVGMHEVTINTFIKWAYGVQRAQVQGPGLLTSERYDIEAKADGAAGDDAMKAMMRSLLMERFGLAFHEEKKELRSFALMIGKGGPAGVRLKQAASDKVPYRKNLRMGTTARALTMQEFATFLGDPLEKPVVDKT